MVVITEKEIKLLNEFREKLLDIVESEYKRSNGYLIHWIRQADCDLTKAEFAYRRAIKWRADLRIDTILEEDLGELERKFPYEFTLDKGGLPVAIVQFGKYDIREQVENGNREQMLRFMLKLCEKIVYEIQGQANKTNGEVNQFMGIFDLDGFSFRQVTSTKTIGFMSEVATTAETYWPLTVNALYIINAPSIFKILFALLKPFFSSTTISGVKVFSSNRENWEEGLLKRISPENLPIYYGGKKTESIFNELSPPSTTSD